jgi:hypothetical protein
MPPATNKSFGKARLKLKVGCTLKNRIARQKLHQAKQLTPRNIEGLGRMFLTQGAGHATVLNTQREGGGLRTSLRGRPGWTMQPPRWPPAAWTASGR